MYEKAYDGIVRILTQRFSILLLLLLSILLLVENKLLIWESMIIIDKLFMLLELYLGSSNGYQSVCMRKLMMELLDYLLKGFLYYKWSQIPIYRKLHDQSMNSQRVFNYNQIIFEFHQCQENHHLIHFWVPKNL